MTGPSHRLRVLYVEDEPDIQTIARLALETIGGFAVEMCSSGLEAVQRAPEFMPDIVLLDVMMPGMDGQQTYAELRLQPTLAKVPVVFMTAKVQPDEVSRYRELGAAAVIEKPFDPMALPGRVTEVLRRWPAAAA